jgi:Transglycosylase-like domain
MRKFVAIVALASAVSACTPGQHQAWLEWFGNDPEAAMDFAFSGCGDLGCAVQGDEPDSSSDPEPDFSGGGTVWDELAECESGGNWSINTGNGYYGGLQFLLSTWQANGGSGYPHENSREEQIRVAENLRAHAGFSPWPACSAALGL